MKNDACKNMVGKLSRIQDVHSASSAYSKIVVTPKWYLMSWVAYQDSWHNPSLLTFPYSLEYKLKIILPRWHHRNVGTQDKNVTHHLRGLDGLRVAGTLSFDLCSIQRWYPEYWFSPSFTAGENQTLDAPAGAYWARGRETSVQKCGPGIPATTPYWFLFLLILIS